MKYAEVRGGIIAYEPSISGQPITQFVSFILDRLCWFVEEFTAHSLQRQMPAEITITEIPVGSRLAEAPKRFTLNPCGWRPATMEYKHSMPLHSTRHELCTG